MELMEQLLSDYHDKEIVDFIRYGWPIEVKDIQAGNWGVPVNQKGARSNPAKLHTYLESELGRGGVIGPFKDNPLGKEAVFSPLDAIPKKDSSDLWVIMNLSFPHDGSAVNAGMNKDVYWGSPTNLVYPNVEDLVKLIKKKGHGSLLFKWDLLKCYRQIFMDPGSIFLLGFTVAGYMYFDVVLTMGLRIACYICQHITNALMFIYNRLDYEGIDYLDDLGGAETWARAWEVYWCLGKLL